MPRLSPQLLRQVQTISPHLALLLRPCRNLNLAQNEFRWLKDHAIEKVEEFRQKDVNSKAIESPRSITTQKQKQQPCDGSRGSKQAAIPGWQSLLTHYVDRRAKGEPLQYIIGTQPFGDLDILCEPGVLIPRPETERIVEKTADLIKRKFLNAETVHPKLADCLYQQGAKEEPKLLKDADVRPELRVLDLCTGTGCIPLLLCNILSKLKPRRTQTLRFYGIDVSPQALSLARRNRRSALSSLLSNWSIHFFRANVLNTSLPNSTHPSTSTVETTFDTLPDAPPILSALHHVFPTAGNSPPKIDVLISNPPYISPTAYSNGTTSRSVRRYEPELALVPPPIVPNVARGDEFYAKILEVAKYTEAELVVFEVGDPDQAQRIKRMMEDGSRWEGYMDVWEIGGEEGVQAVVGSKDMT